VNAAPSILAVVDALKAAQPGEMDFAKASAIVKGLLAG